jgi:hypothetical protein
MLQLIREIAGELKEQGRAQLARERLDRIAANLNISPEQLVERLAAVFGCSFYLDDERAVLLPVEHTEPVTLPPRRACVCPRAYYTEPLQSCCFL